MDESAPGRSVSRRLSRGAWGKSWLVVPVVAAVAAAVVAAAHDQRGGDLPDGLPAVPAAPLRCASGEFTALSYNVYLGSSWLESMADSFFHDGMIGGFQPWSARSAQMRALFREYAPDLVGLQEMGTDADVAALTDTLSGYATVSYHLGPLQYADSAILFRADRFALLDSGHVRLAPAADPAADSGFKPWTLPRVANWALLRERSSGFTVLFVNAHLDPHKANARLGAAILRERLGQERGALPMVVTGDFNSTAATERYQLLTGADLHPALLSNTFFGAAEQRVFEPGHGPRALGPADQGFSPEQRIDHVLTGGPCRAIVDSWLLDARTLPGGAELSDHAPIVTKLHFTD